MVILNGEMDQALSRLAEVMAVGGERGRHGADGSLRRLGHGEHTEQRERGHELSRVVVVVGGRGGVFSGGDDELGGHLVLRGGGGGGGGFLSHRADRHRRTRGAGGGGAAEGGGGAGGEGEPLHAEDGGHVSCLFVCLFVFFGVLWWGAVVEWVGRMRRALLSTTVQMDNIPPLQQHQQQDVSNLENTRLSEAT